MTEIHRPGAILGAAPASLRSRPGGSLRPERPVAPLPALRRFEVTSLDDNGDPVRIVRSAPGFPLLVDAFSAFSRGSLVATPMGPLAVEDLEPGMEVVTPAHGPARLVWIGSMSMPAGDGGSHLYRIAGDTFGPDRPMPDLLLGPSARLLRPVRSAPGGKAFVPVADFEDGENVVRVQPFAPVQLFHLAFETQVALRVNGVEVESFHPGPALTGREGSDLVSLLLGFFPSASEIGDFGRLAHPRLNPGEFDPMRAG